MQLMNCHKKSLEILSQIKYIEGENGIFKVEDLIEE